MNISSTENNIIIDQLNAEQNMIRPRASIRTVLQFVSSPKKHGIKTQDLQELHQIQTQISNDSHESKLTMVRGQTTDRRDRRRSSSSRKGEKKRIEETEGEEAAAAERER